MKENTTWFGQINIYATWLFVLCSRAPYWSYAYLDSCEDYHQQAGFGILQACFHVNSWVYFASCIVMCLSGGTWLIYQLRRFILKITTKNDAPAQAASRGRRSLGSYFMWLIYGLNAIFYLIFISSILRAICAPTLYL